MKSKKLTIASSVLVVAVSLGSLWLYRASQSPFSGTLEKEWLEPRFPEKIDTEDAIWQVLPFGYTLGPWPIQFRNEPIVTKLTYLKGPPKKFIQSMTQLWQPVEIELKLLGPKTISPGTTQLDWKKCFEAYWTCNSPRGKIMEYLAHKKDEGVLAQATWFDHPESAGPRGVHLVWDHPQYQIDDFVLFTEGGIAQGFELKTVKTDAGTEARTLLYQILGAMKVKEDLSNSREWIQGKIRSVQLAQIQRMQEPKLRLKKLIEIQSWLFSLLSVDPSQVTPFFHLAGVTHLFALDLLKLQTHYYENQESWILYARPNLNALQKYAEDFDAENGAAGASTAPGADSNAAAGTVPGDSKNIAVAKQIESLIEDVLLQQDKVTSSLKK